MSDTVTGMTYKHPRVRGNAPWSPQAKTVRLLSEIQGVLDEYANQLPLTARQVFYRLVGSCDYDKTERAYERLTETLNRARRAGYIEWDAIRDDGVTTVEASGFTDPASFVDAVLHTAERYRVHPGTLQRRRVEVWCEAAGMLPQMRSAAHDYGAFCQTSGGFDSVTAKHDVARRFLRDGRQAVVLHVGDHDPSGCSVIDSAASDVNAFVADLGGLEPIWQRVAVTPEQITDLDLPSAPAKKSDRRGDFTGGTVQAEALTPTQLRQIVQDALRSVTDESLLEEASQRSTEEREILTQAVSQLRI